METSSKIIAIYNSFDGEELLEGSIECIREHVDFILVVAQKVSNYGEKYDGGYNLANSLNTVDLVIEYNPNLKLNGATNETIKRNIGIEYAKQNGFGYFILMDNDEYYQDFGRMKKDFLNSGADGSVCRLWTFYKEPTLRLEEQENYFVPFIHKLHLKTKTGNNIYPKYVDPTRRINTTNVIVMQDPMFHYSYVRKSIIRKLSNSSASPNISKKIKTILDDYNNACEGYFVKDFQQKLISVPNIFNIIL